MNSAYEKCIRYLLANGYKETEETGKFRTFKKKGGVAVDISENEMVITCDRGDWLQRRLDYYTLVGIMVDTGSITNHISV